MSTPSYICNFLGTFHGTVAAEISALRKLARHSRAASFVRVCNNRAQASCRKTHGASLSLTLKGQVRLARGSIR